MKNILRKYYKWLIALSVLLVSVIVLISVCDRIIRKSAEEKLFTDIAIIPHNHCGLLLGTSKYLSDGRENLYYRYRIDAAAALLFENKINYLVVSGDNSSSEYDEPGTMIADLITLGVDSSKLYADYAGFRTLDSVVRLKEIFGQESVTIISQGFHNERAIYLAQKNGIEAIGFNTKDVTKFYGLKTSAREKLARVKVFLDDWFGVEPKYLGAQIIIPKS